MAFLAVIFFILIKITHAETAVVFYSRTPLEGDTVAVSFPVNFNVVSSSFDGNVVSIFTYKGKQRAIFGISPTATPGDRTFAYELRGGDIKKETITIKKKLFPKLVLGIPKELGVSSGQLVQNLATQNASIRKIVSLGESEPLFTSGFGLPLYDNRKITSVFGEIRQTGLNQIRHLGVDFGGRLGVSVAAMNSGRVAQAYFDETYGNSVIIDHGAQIFSLYLHLNEMKVKEGAMVKKGQVIGTLGKTGYATSPHLHLSLKIGGVSVDPLRFVSMFSNL